MPTPTPTIRSSPTAFTRRSFLYAAGAAAASPFILPVSVLNRLAFAVPGDQVTIGMIGMGKRAFELIGAFLNRDDVRILAVCDVDTTRREHARKLVNDKYANSDCAQSNDYRDLIARKDINAVVIATPDHWHANQVLDAAAAKKDIYCEKPLTLNLREGQLMIEACRKHGVVFQTGSQQRTEMDGRFVTACEYIRSGRLGKIKHVGVGVGESSKPCDLPEETLEPGLDWDRWLGPAPKRPYNAILSPRGVHNHYPSWRLYQEYSGGMMTDFGAHNFDIAQWGLGMDNSGPVEITPPSDPTAMYGCVLKYANGTTMSHDSGQYGITFQGENGSIFVWRDKLTSIPEGILKEPLKDSDVHLPRAKDHIDNWMQCIRSRAKPICDVEVGARSIACAHLCNLAYWHRRPLKWDPAMWNFGSDSQANAWLDYQRRKGFELARI